MCMELTTQERLLVNSELQKRGKNVALTYILLLLVGMFGAHRFYLGKTGTAITQLVLTLVGMMTLIFVVGYILLFVVSIWVLIDVFLVYREINRQNAELEKEIMESIHREKEVE